MIKVNTRYFLDTYYKDNQYLQCESYMAVNSLIHRYIQLNDVDKYDVYLYKAELKPYGKKISLTDDEIEKLIEQVTKQI